MISLKKFKPLIWLYNILHYKTLLHNKKAYVEYGIKKSLFSSLSSKNFPDKKSKAWLDLNDSSIVSQNNKDFYFFDIDIQNKILNWSKNGYLILESHIKSNTCDEINNEIEKLLINKIISKNESNKIMFAFKKSSLLENIINEERLIKTLSFILGKEVIPFQTINFINGSEQLAHSDSIHMTTYPLGYLIAVWIALEDIIIDNGPLFYYPGSHKLPYMLNEDFNDGGNLLFNGNKDYIDYEKKMAEVIKGNNLQSNVFLAKKGDAFIWHANLIHGGMPVINKSLTRKSMVIHYFAKDVIKYHEITERPSLL